MVGSSPSSPILPCMVLGLLAAAIVSNSQRLWVQVSEDIQGLQTIYAELLAATCRSSRTVSVIDIFSQLSNFQILGQVTQKSYMHAAHKRHDADTYP